MHPMEQQDISREALWDAASTAIIVLFSVMLIGAAFASFLDGIIASPHLSWNLAAGIVMVILAHHIDGIVGRYGE